MKGLASDVTHPGATTPSANERISKASIVPCALIIGQIFQHDVRGDVEGSGTYSGIPLARAGHK